MSRREKQRSDNQISGKTGVNSINGPQITTFSAQPEAKMNTGKVFFPRFTIEIALYVSIFLLAILLRLALLESHPLEASESARALSAWNLIQFESPDAWTDPLPIFLTAISFLLFGANDTIARLQPALTGSILVLLPWFLRSHIGRIGALVAALLMATSPTLVFYSRTLSGDMIGLFVFFALVCLVINWRENDTKSMALSALFALLLASGTPTVSYLIIGSLAAIVFYSTSSDEKYFSRIVNDWRAQGNPLRLLSIFWGTLIIVTTAFFTYARGFSLISLQPWLAQFETSGNNSPWFFPVQALALYEPILLIMGTLGLIYLLMANSRERSHPVSNKLIHFLTIWVIVGMILAFSAGEKNGSHIVVILPPLALATGLFVQRTFGRFDLPGVVRAGKLASVLAPVMIFTVLLITQYSHSAIGVTWYQWGLLVLSLAVTVGSTAVAVGQNRWGSMVALLVLGGMLVIPYTIHTNTWLNYRTSGAEFLPSGIASPSISDALENIERRKALMPSEKEFNIIINQDLRYPFTWYLRNYERVTYTAKPAAGASVIIAREQNDTLSGFDGYRSMKTSVSSRTSISSFLPGKFWRWLIYREPFEPGSSVKAITYIKE